MNIKQYRRSFIYIYINFEETNLQKSIILKENAPNQKKFMFSLDFYINCAKIIYAVKNLFEMEVITMARECYATGVKGMSGNKRSHAMNTSKRKWKANLQKVRIIDENGEEKRVLVSARALKSGLVKRA